MQETKYGSLFFEKIKNKKATIIHITGVAKGNDDFASSPASIL